MTSQNLLSLLIVVILWTVAWQFRALKVRQAILLGASYFFIRTGGFNKLSEDHFLCALGVVADKLVVKIQ